jgi:hypothetical protein
MPRKSAPSLALAPVLPGRHRQQPPEGLDHVEQQGFSASLGVGCAMTGARLPLVHGLAAVIGAGGARFPAVGEGEKQIGELGVAVLLDKLRHVVAPASAARLASDPERRPANIRKG